jgi:uncharacterized membrane protein YfcA
MIESLFTPQFLTVLVAILLGCFVKGALGFGLPLIATPLMLFVMPLPEIISVLALPITAANIQQIWLNRAHWRILKQFWPLVVTSSLIMLTGSALMVSIDGHILAILIGTMISTHALLSIFPIWRFNLSGVAPHIWHRLIIPAGIVSGVLGSLTSIYSFPSLQLFMSMRIGKNDLAFLLGVFLALGYIAIWFGIRHAGFPVGDGLTLSLTMMVPAIIGQQIGDRMRRRISDATFRNLVHFALACGGITLIIRSLTNI